VTDGQAINALVEYGLKTGLIERDDEIYARNRVLGTLGIDAWDGPGLPEGSEPSLEEILAVLLDRAAKDGLLAGDGVVYRDLFDTKLMDALTPRPSETIARFRALYEKSPREATDWYYRFSQDSDYIRRYRIARDVKWVAHTEFGDLDVTINLSKPEKDPKAIAAALTAKKVAYPKCQLCAENVGYFGRVDHPARETHRAIPIRMAGAEWFLQYSPYVYYNEHCIVFHGDHHPMVIDRSAFAKLFDFVKLFPHYFVGSNADLPIVGGSILTHEHFQGGNYEFAMAKAPADRAFRYAEYPKIEAEIVKWPMSVLRLRAADPARIVDLAGKILDAWRAWSDESAEIRAFSGTVPHNTITPIARRRGERYELDLVLRNNRTTDEHPDGLFHPHREHHHLKKENIGLIEVMGLAILPGRLLTELAAVKDCIVRDGKPEGDLAKHAEWIAELRKKYPNIKAGDVEEMLRAETGIAFAEILGQAGVFKWTQAGSAAFDRFVVSTGGIRTN